MIFTEKSEDNELYVYFNDRLIYKKWLDTGVSKVFDRFAYSKSTTESIKIKILFVCSANKQRSKTASDYFSEKLATYEFDSAGTNRKICNKEGTQPLTEALMEWADLVIVMEEKHRRIISENGGSQFRKNIKVLNIPDHFKYYQKELIQLLEEKVEPLIEDRFFK